MLELGGLEGERFQKGFFGGAGIAVVHFDLIGQALSILNVLRKKTNCVQEKAKDIIALIAYENVVVELPNHENDTFSIGQVGVMHQG